MNTVPVSRPEPAAEPEQRPPRPRLYWIDTLRIALIILVLAHHCAITYGNIPVWYYNEPPTDSSGGLLDIFVILNQTFFMGLFFLIAGYFTPGSLDRKGPGAFARDRLIRLGLPLLAFILVLRPIANLYSWWTMPDRPSYPLYYVFSWDPGPTWFLEVLLVFSLIYAGYRAIRSRSGGQDRQVATAGRIGWWVALVAVLGLIVIMSVITVVWRQPVPDGTYWPIVGLPTPSFLPQYALMFAAGVLAARRQWLTRMPGSLGWVGLGLALVAGILLGPMALNPDPMMASIGSGIVTSVLGVGLSVALLMLFRRVAPGTGPIRRFLSANAFTVYVIHPVILVAGALLISGLVAPAILKFVALLILSVPACWLVASLLRRIPPVGKIM